MWNVGRESRGDCGYIPRQSRAYRRVGTLDLSFAALVKKSSATFQPCSVEFKMYCYNGVMPMIPVDAFLKRWSRVFEGLDHQTATGKFARSNRRVIGEMAQGKSIELPVRTAAAKAQ